MREIKVKNRNGGITLIALIVTIIVLLILAGISIGVLTGEKGLIKKTQQAKEQEEIANEKEVIDIAAIKAMKKDRYGNITKENLDDELTIELGNKYKSKEIEEGIAVTFTESNRSYLVDIDGNVIEYIIREPMPAPEDSELATFGVGNGVIEIEFLNKSGYDISIPNEPILYDGMKAVYWAKDSSGNLDLENPANNVYEITSDDANFKEENWYKYIAQTRGEDGKTSRWANALTKDGSYYVWIPRYSYRIIYFNSQESEDAYRAGTLTEEEALKQGDIIGYSDARGMVDSSGKKPTAMSSTTAISVNDKYFRTHPVFDGNPEEGGWDSKLEGIWIMKYEASKEGASTSSMGTGTMPKSVPNVLAWRYINLSSMYTYAKDAYNTLNSHMIKNSEWGALAYLAESKYGRNGNEISVNQCLHNVTGAGRGLNKDEDSTQTGTSTIYNEIYSIDVISDEQKYNGTIGQLSSTTGNIYGIYDISGGTYEYVMGLYQDEEGNIYTGNSTTKNSGFNGFLYDGNKKEDGIELPNEKKYYQSYINTTNSPGDTDGAMLGDGIKETKSWYNDTAGFINYSNPICIRGSDDTKKIGAGAFSVRTNDGSATNIAFRVCLAIK